MNRLSKNSLIVAAAVVIAGTFWFGLNAGKGDEPEATSITHVFPTKTEPIPIQDAAKNAQQLSPISISKLSSNAMLDEYYRKRSGRAFVAYAIQHPELGGIFYARDLLRKCSLIRYGDTEQLQGVQKAVDSDSNGPTHLQRTKAIQFLREKCSDFTDAELAEIDTLAENSYERDVLKQESKKLHEAQAKKNIDEINGAVKEVLDRADPIFIDQKGPQILSPGVTQVMTVYFMGKPYRLSTEVVLTAVYLLPCEIGLRCRMDEDITLAYQCASGRGCFESRSDHALAEMVGGNEERYSEAEQLAKEMAAAIRQKNTAAFMPKL
jgi:hypothetical protein